MKPICLNKQLLSIFSTGQVVEIALTSESGGNVARGIPTVKVEKRKVLSGTMIIPKVRDSWITTGRAQVGDITLVTAEQVAMDSKIEHDSIQYDVIEEITADSYIGKQYSYIIRRRQ